VRFSRVAGLCVAVAALLSWVEPNAFAAPHKDQLERPTRTISIAVNGEPLETSTPPIVVDGRLLVPLRDVFGALGIGVSRSGNTIAGRLPGGTVNITVGTPNVVVDGANVTLDGSVIDRAGTTYMPLRLINAALGAQAAYDQRGANVQIVSTFVGRNSGAEQQRPGGGIDVQGVVSALDTDSAPPSLTVVRGGASRTISVTSEAKVWTDDVTIHSQMRGALGGVRVGDAVHAILARDGRVVSIFDFYKSVSGTVAAVSPNAIVLANGRVVTPSGTTEVSLDTAAARLVDLKVGDYVTIRSNPESGELRAIDATRNPATLPPSTAANGAPAPTDVAIAKVAVSPAQPLRLGESFDIVMNGTPGGRAHFDIGEYLKDLPMVESPPGTYAGHFTVPERFNVTQVPIYASLSVGTSAAVRVAAPQTLTAATTPPTIGDVAPPQGQTVNNTRPSIYATFNAPTGVAINEHSVSLSVNGHDVTSSVTRSNAFVTYAPGIDLPSGPVTVVVRVADAAGNASTKTWSFTIGR
jgi:uncharacterized Zn-binding protein involved in type VI secretion